MDEQGETSQHDFRSKTALMQSFPVDYEQIKGCLKKSMKTNISLNKVKMVCLFILVLLVFNKFL